MKISDKQYSCIIIDDDFSSIGVLKHYISLVPKLELRKSFLDPIAGAREIKAMETIDFLFLDINMPVSGLDIASLIREQVKYLIIVTAYSENALAAFKVDADDFVVKPLSFAKFLSTINRAFAKRIFS